MSLESSHDLHDSLGEMAATWIANRSQIVDCTSEMELAPGYIPDMIVVCRPWGSVLAMLLGTPGFGKTNESMRDQGAEISFVFESKASRSDYMRTFGNPVDYKRLQPVAQFHFVVSAKGIVKPEEVPGFWGLLEQKGRGLRLTKRPTLCPVGKSAVGNIALKLLWRGKWRQGVKQEYVKYCPDCRGKMRQLRDDVGSEPPPPPASTDEGGNG
jgi:hypothetical protein